MSVLDVVVLVSAMVVALLAGLYAGLGLRTEPVIDRRAELWFAAFMWAGALAGAYLVLGTGDDAPDWTATLGVGMVNGTQVLLVVWSLLHLPNLRTLETPAPRLFPAFALVLCVVTIVLLGVAVAIEGLP